MADGVKLVFRGSNAAASLKRLVEDIRRQRTLDDVFRGSNAAASLKHADRVAAPAARRPVFRGSNAAASLKRAHRVDDAPRSSRGLPRQQCRGFIEAENL